MWVVGLQHLENNSVYMYPSKRGFRTLKSQAKPSGKQLPVFLVVLVKVAREFSFLKNCCVGLPCRLATIPVGNHGHNVVISILGILGFPEVE